MEMPEFLGGLFKIMGMQLGDKVSVQKLRPEHLLEYKKKRSDRLKLKEEMKVLITRAKAIDAQIDADNAELWQWLYKEYNLPPDQHYEIDKDGTVWKYVEKKEGPTE